MDITRACRDIDELHPLAKQACNLFLAECKKQGVNVFITETYRSQARQNYLYEQGRTRSGQVVTWTKSSNHTGRMAWDIAVSPPKALYDITTLNKAGAIAKELGITWGGSWKTPDRPHFEIKSSWKPKNDNKKGDDIVSKPAFPSQMPINNNDTPSVWAKEAWEFAKKEGLLDGSRPKDAITREELAIVLMRMVNK